MDVLFLCGGAHFVSGSHDINPCMYAIWGVTMATRSTRNRIRFQAEKAIQNIERAMQNLAQLDGMADGNSPYIGENLPQIIVMMAGCQQVLVQFRDKL
ncbi:unnamed protein product [marine sediment metagenome]|uniref:Uncharacterized protein n=1 Tax=marine sediment metagenome TaxID=412755 RepID=X1GXQ8_9ZZZZ